MRGSPPDWTAPDSAFLPLSFERPEPFNQIPEGESPWDPIQGRQANHLAPAEWRLLAWLEREGLAYDTYSDAQLDDGTLDLAWSNLVQYDSESRLLGVQSRLRLTLRPGSDVFLVLERGWLRDEQGRYPPAYHRGSAKLQYTFRL